MCSPASGGLGHGVSKRRGDARIPEKLKGGLNNLTCGNIAPDSLQHNSVWKNEGVTSVCKLVGLQPITGHFCKKTTAKKRQFTITFSFGDSRQIGVDRHFHFWRGKGKAMRGERSIWLIDQNYLHVCSPELLPFEEQSRSCDGHPSPPLKWSHPSGLIRPAGLLSSMQVWTSSWSSWLNVGLCLSRLSSLWGICPRSSVCTASASASAWACVLTCFLSPWWIAHTTLTQVLTSSSVSPELSGLSLFSFFFCGSAPAPPSFWSISACFGNASIRPLHNKHCGTKVWNHANALLEILTVGCEVTQNTQSISKCQILGRASQWCSTIFLSCWQFFRALWKMCLLFLIWTPLPAVCLRWRWGNNHLIDYCPCPHLLNEQSLPRVGSLHVVHLNMIMWRLTCAVCAEEAQQASPDTSKQARASCSTSTTSRSTEAFVCSTFYSACVHLLGCVCV